MQDWDRHAKELDQFIGAVRRWQAARERGRGDEVKSEVFRTLGGAEAALDANNASVVLWKSVSSHIEANNLTDAIYNLSYTPLTEAHAFDSLLTQLDAAHGRIREVAAQQRSKQAVIEAPGPVRRARNRWDVLSRGMKIFLGLPGFAASCLLVWQVVDFLF